MGQDAVEFVTERLARWREFGSNGLLDFRHAAVAPFDGGAAPVHLCGFEAFARGVDGVLDWLRVMRRGGGERLFVAQQQQGFRRRLQPAFVIGRRQQFRQPGGLDAKQAGQLTEQPRLDFAPILERGENLLAQFGHALTGAGHDRDDGHAEQFGELFGVNRVTEVFGHIHHVQREDRAMAEFDDLGGVVKIALEIGGIHDHDDDIGRGQLGQAGQQHVARDLFIERVGAEAVSAGEIEHPDVRRRALEPALLAFDGDAGVIADLCAQTGEGIEQRGLAGIRVAGQGDVGLAGFHARQVGRWLVRRAAHHRPGTA